MAEDSKSDKDGEPEKIPGENGKIGKRGRGRLRKEAPATEEAKGMRKFLGLDNMPYEEVFKGKDKINRSPAKGEGGRNGKEEDRERSSECQESVDGGRSHTSEDEEEEEKAEKRREVKVRERHRESEREKTEREVEAGGEGLSEENRVNLMKELAEKVSRLESVVNELKLENILIKSEIREESKRWGKERNEYKEEIRAMKETMQLWRLKEERRRADRESEERESVSSTEGNNQEDGTEGRRRTETIENELNNMARILAEGNRKYLEEIPDSLGKSEYEWELKERKGRKKNIMIRGVKMTGKDLKKEVKEIIRNYLGLEIYIRNIRAIGRGLPY